MKFTRIWETVVFEFKSLRLYWFPIVTMTVIVPFSYLLIAVLSSGSSQQSFLITLSGFSVISVFLVLVLPLAQRVSNMFSDDVVELLASLPISIRELVIAYILTYTLLSIPLVVGLTVLFILNSAYLNVGLLLLGILGLWCLASTTGIVLGFTVRNKLKLDPLLSILLLVVIVITPAFYPIKNTIGPFKILILANPLTHVVSIIRASIGINEETPLMASIIYLVLMFAVFVLVIVNILRNVTLSIIERK